MSSQIKISPWKRKKIDLMLKEADGLENMQRYVNISNLVGTSTSIVGGVGVIGCLMTAPFTGGLSTLGAFGFCGLGVAGGSLSIGTLIGQNFKEKQILKNVETALNHHESERNNENTFDVSNFHQRDQTAEMKSVNESEKVLHSLQKYQSAVMKCEHECEENNENNTDVLNSLQKDQSAVMKCEHECEENNECTFDVPTSHQRDQTAEMKSVNESEKVLNSLQKDQSAVMKYDNKREGNNENHVPKSHQKERTAVMKCENESTKSNRDALDSYQNDQTAEMKSDNESEKDKGNNPDFPDSHLKDKTAGMNYENESEGNKENNHDFDMTLQNLKGTGAYDENDFWTSIALKTLIVSVVGFLPLSIYHFVKTLNSTRKGSKNDFAVKLRRLANAERQGPTNIQ